MKQYGSKEIFCWQKRLMTQQEGEDLYVHLNHLYEIIREIKVILASSQIHGSIIEGYLKQIDETKEQQDND